MKLSSKLKILIVLFSLTIIFSCQTEENFIENKTHTVVNKQPKINYYSGKNAKGIIDKLYLKLGKQPSSNAHKYDYFRTTEDYTIDFSRIMEVIDEVGNVNYTFKVNHPESTELIFYNLILSTTTAGQSKVKLVKYVMDQEFANNYYNGTKSINQFKGTISHENIVYNSNCPDLTEITPFPVDFDIPISDINTTGNGGTLIAGSFPSSGTNTFGGGALGFGLTHTTWSGNNDSGSNNGSNSGNDSGSGSNTTGPMMCQMIDTDTLYNADGTVAAVIVYVYWVECGAQIQNRQALVYSLTTYNSNCYDPTNPGNTIGVLDPVNLTSAFEQYLTPEELFWLDKSKPFIYNQVLRYLNSPGADIEFISEIISILYENEAGNYDLSFDITHLIAENSSTPSKKEVKLRVATNTSNVPWNNITGNYRNIPSLAYNGKRTIYINSVPLVQYKLNNGDFISEGDYGIWHDFDFRVYYYSSNYKLWHQIPEPTTYNHLDVSFIFNQFWSLVQTGVRYCTPLEDIVVLIDGKDFDGVETSKAIAGILVIVDITPVGKVTKITRKAGLALSNATPVIPRVLSFLDKSQRSVKNNFKNIISVMPNARKGNFGEICTDVDFFEKGYDVLHTRRVTSIDQAGHQGIDHIFKNPQTGEFVIVESKFHGTGGLNPGNPATGLAPQMSDAWISNGQKNNTDRLWVALEGNLSLYNQIRPNASTLNYTRVVAYVQANGTVNYKYVSSEGIEISTVFSN